MSEISEREMQNLQAIASGGGRHDLQRLRDAMGMPLRRADTLDAKLISQLQKLRGTKAKKEKTSATPKGNSKDQRRMMSRLAEFGGGTLVEAVMRDRGTGGRVEEYAGGALEWIPNLPDGTPQAGIGDVFYEPESSGVRKARGGFVKGYRNGGLASAAGSPEEDPLDAAVETPAEIIEAAKQPQDYGERARAISKMTRDKALERLRSGQSALREKKYDQTSKWLALAQGMLSPTRTGGFGESVGTAAGLVREEVGSERDFMENRAVRLEEMESDMAGVEGDYADREIDILGEEERSRSSFRGNLKDLYIKDPNDPTKNIRVLGAFNQETRKIEPLYTPEGEIALRPDDMDPFKRFQLAQAGERGKTGVTIGNTDIENLKLGKQRLASGYRALDLLAEIKDEGGTSGFRKLVQKGMEFLGSDAEHVKSRGEFMALAGDQLFAALDGFGTQINEKELTVARDELAPGGSRATAVNEGIIQQLVQKLEAEVLNTGVLVKEFGDDRQVRTAMLPMINYDFSEEMLERGKGVGLTFHKHIPFGEEDTVDVNARTAGDPGTMGNPHKPANEAEFNEWMRNRVQYDIRKNDIIDVPGKGLRPVTTDIPN